MYRLMKLIPPVLEVSTRPETTCKSLQVHHLHTAGEDVAIVTRCGVMKQPVMHPMACGRNQWYSRNSRRNSRNFMTKVGATLTTCGHFEYAWLMGTDTVRRYGLEGGVSL